MGSVGGRARGVQGRTRRRLAEYAVAKGDFEAAARHLVEIADAFPEDHETLERLVELEVSPKYTIRGLEEHLVVLDSRVELARAVSSAPGGLVLDCVERPG